VTSAPEIVGLLGKELHGLALDLGARPQDLDPRSRQHAALLAFGRRTSARPPVSILVQDAVSLLLEILEGDLGGHSEVVSGQTLILRAFTLDANKHPRPCGSREVQFDPSQCLAGYVLHTSNPATSACISSDRRFTDLFLREQGVVSALSVPLPVDDGPYGTIEVYCTRPREFAVGDVRFAETISHLLSASLGRARAEEQLRAERTRAAAVLATVQNLVVLLDEQGHVLNINHAAQQALGLSLEHLRARSFWGTLVPEEDLELFRVALGEAHAGRPAQLVAHLLNKDNQKLDVHWNISAVKQRDGDAPTILLSGTLIGPAGPAPAPFAPMPGAAKGQDLRTSPRRTFPYRQLIAPMYTGVIPSRNKFFEVPCRDISAGGVSFYLATKPDFDSLLVALGKAPSLSYFTARVMRVSEEVIDDQVMHLVGCRFTGRVHL